MLSEMFHFSCAGVAEDDVPDGLWHCHTSSNIGAVRPFYSGRHRGGASFKIQGGASLKIQGSASSLA
jgi:hypothetical protein